MPGLACPVKFGYSLLLSGAMAFYAITWFNVIYSVYFGSNLEDEDRFLGIGLGVLASEDAAKYNFWFILHALSLFTMLLAGYLLFKKTSLRRRVKGLIWKSSIILALLDLTAWFHAPSCSSSNMYVGMVGIISALPLTFLALMPLSQMWIYRRWRSPDGKMKKVLFVGGGFAGLYAAMGLNRKLGYHNNLEITLIDQKNYFLKI